MIGSEKQIRWAEKIKAEALNTLKIKKNRYSRVESGEMDDYDGSEAAFHNRCLQAEAILESVSEAWWWIDNRECGDFGIAGKVLRNLSKDRDPKFGFKNAR